MTEQQPLRKSRAHFDATHARWRERRNRFQENPDYRDEWYAEQCGMCRYWIPLTKPFGLDYGACSDATVTL